MYSTFRRAQAPMKSESGGASKPDWKFLKAMNFEKEFLKYRNGHGNVSPGDSGDVNEKLPTYLHRKLVRSKPGWSLNKATDQINSSS